jgi:hypothetical protein
MAPDMMMMGQRGGQCFDSRSGQGMGPGGSTPMSREEFEAQQQRARMERHQAMHAGPACGMPLSREEFEAAQARAMQRRPDRGPAPTGGGPKSQEEFEQRQLLAQRRRVDDQRATESTRPAARGVDAWGADAWAPPHEGDLHASKKRVRGDGSDDGTGGERKRQDKPVRQ